MTLTPGVLFLLQSLPKQLLPLAAVALAKRCLPQNASMSAFAWSTAYVLAIPVSLIIKNVYKQIQQEVEIRRLGARRLPQVPTWWPGGVDVMLRSIKSFTNGYTGDYLTECADLLGPTFTLRILGEDTMFTFEPDYIKAILATEFDDFEKGEIFRSYAQSVLGSGVFNSDGNMWKFHRSITRPFFVQERITDFDTFNRHADIAVSKLKQRFAEGESVDFQDIMSRFTLDSATEFLFGSCVNTLLASLPYAWNSPRHKEVVTTHTSDRFAVAFTAAQHHLALRSRRASVWPLWELWKDQTKESMDIIYDFISPLIKEALSKKGLKQSGVGSEKEEDGQPTTLLDHLVQQTDDDTIIRDETLNIMIAGRDTTMATLTFVIYCLSQHPEALAKLRNEILSTIGKTSTPTIEDVRQCKYLRAVINETLRLYPPVPFDVRHSKRSTVFRAPDGGKPYYIPGDVEIAYSVWMMHRRTDLWGPDATKFDPDRFLDERVHKYLTPNPFIFLPFNAGPRICLGQQFAYNEASFMLIRLLQNFDSITLTPDAQPPASRPPEGWKAASGTQATEKLWPKSHLTLYSYMGLWLKMGEGK